jgi:membrane-associated protease RseP (regulator of RpoE activity)
MHSSLSEDQWDAMFRAQCTWDAVMAHNAVEALKRHGGPGAIMVVLIGQGHVAFNLGAPRQAAPGFEGKIASLIPIPVVDEKREPVEVRASYADFIWGVPYEEDPIFPVLGISTREGKEKPGHSVIDVQKESVAEACGFLVGDELVSVDDTPVPDKESLNRLLSTKRWADEARVKVKRGGEEKGLACQLRRSLAEPAKDGGKRDESKKTPPRAKKG